SFILSSSNRCILLYSFLKQSVSTLSYTLSLHDALPICLIVTSACMSGPIAGALLDGNEEQAYRRAEWFREIFGEDFYIEVMSENPADLNLGLLKIADELQIKPILTEDAHFVHPDDLWVEESLLAVSTRPKQIKGMTVANAPEGDIVEKLNHIYGKDRPMTFQDFSLFMAGREYRQQQMLEQGIDREDI